MYSVVTNQKSERTYCYNVLKSNVFSGDQSKINNSGFLFVFHFKIKIIKIFNLYYIYLQNINIHSHIYIISNSLTHMCRHARTHTCTHALTNKTYTHEHTCKHREREREQWYRFGFLSHLFSKTKLRSIHWGYHVAGWSLQARLFRWDYSKMEISTCV